jgi:hypothetical protein
MRFEVLTAVKLLMFVFWAVTPCGLVGRRQNSGGTYLISSSGIFSAEHGDSMLLQNVGI